ncbi:hypothetical protein GQ44DRAFT_771440 [Phaeosphaeriaceae sp. PMI808]|nr:hypothetical protein GQ44DRAFT_771440 [Phaeosphaeriaceae sp. PMI808]
MRSWIRCKGMTDGYDTDEECFAQQQPYQADLELGTKTPPPMPAGLVPLDFGGEVNDHGEESYHRAKMLSRALRRLERWEDGRITPRSRVKGFSGGGGRNGVEGNGDGGGRMGAEDEDEDEDEDMQDADDLRREEESESNSEDEDMERGGMMIK